MKKVRVVTADTSVHNTALAPVDLNAVYVPPKNPVIVDKCIQVLNQLCKRYKYAVLNNHEVVSDDELEFTLDYMFNGKEHGTVSIVLSKMSNGSWTSRNYLSVKRAAKLPVTNFSNFISEFNKILKNLHLVISDKPQVNV